MPTDAIRRSRKLSSSSASSSLLSFRRAFKPMVLRSPITMKLARRPGPTTLWSTCFRLAAWANMSSRSPQSVDFLSQVRDRWGELCRTPERASRTADDFLPTLRLSSSPEHRGYVKGTTACLSCLLAAGRHQEPLDLIETAPFLWWHYRRYGVQALAAQGRADEAIDYAGRSLGRNDGPSDMARTGEEILLAAGRDEAAYRRFACTANRAGSHLASFRAIKRKYPDKAPRAILDDRIAQAPGKEGKWFATPKDLGLPDPVPDLGPGPDPALPGGHRHPAAGGPGPPGPRAGLHPGDGDHGPGLDGRGPALRAEGRDVWQAMG